MTNNTTSTIPGAVILSSWENVKRAMQAAACGNRGAGVVKVVVLFNRCGEPVRHTKPIVTSLEPKGSNEDTLGWLEALGE